MASFFTIILDTIAPATTAIKINNGAAYVNDADRLCTVTITTGDSNTTGYQMKIWGDIDTSNNTSIQSTEGTSSWISYEREKQIKLSSGDGIKNVYCKLRDDVGNESSIVSAQTILDTEIHVVTVQSQSVTKISAVEGYNTVTFSFFVSDTNPAVDSFTEYKVCCVSASSVPADEATAIGITNGSVNMSATGTFKYDEPISCTIKTADLVATAAGAGDGSKIIKVYAKSADGVWSN